MSCTFDTIKYEHTHARTHSIINKLINLNSKFEKNKRKAIYTHKHSLMLNLFESE